MPHQELSDRIKNFIGVESVGVGLTPNAIAKANNVSVRYEISVELYALYAHNILQTTTL